METLEAGGRHGQEIRVKGSKAEQNLKAAFAGESQANRRYLYFAQKADMEGTTTSPRCSARPPRARPARPMAITVDGAAAAGIGHPNYGHMAVMPETTRAALTGDLD